MKGRAIALIAIVLTGTLWPACACAMSFGRTPAGAHACCPHMPPGGSRASAATCCSNAPHPALIPTEAQSVSPLPPAAAPAIPVAAVAADPSFHILAFRLSGPPPGSDSPPGAVALRI